MERNQWRAYVGIILVWFGLTLLHAGLGFIFLGVMFVLDDIAQVKA